MLPAFWGLPCIHIPKTDPERAALWAGIAVPHSDLWEAAAHRCSEHRCWAGSCQPLGIWSFHYDAAPLRATHGHPSSFSLSYFFLFLLPLLSHSGSSAKGFPCSAFPPVAWAADQIGNLSFLLVPGPHFGSLMVCILW